MEKERRTAYEGVTDFVPKLHFTEGFPCMLRRAAFSDGVPDGWILEGYTPGQALASEG
jgi:hypothetical protein